MAEATIPVDLFNPGQVFACLGFMEAAEILLGDAEGGFDWSDEANVRFILRAAGGENPLAAVLEFLAEADPKRWGPIGYSDPPPKRGKKSNAEEGGEDAEESEADEDDGPATGTGAPALELAETFPAPEGDKMSLPIRIGGGNRPIVELGHWADGSGRNSFKLYSGNRSALSIACSMLFGVRAKPSKSQRENGQPGDLKFKGVRQLWEEQRGSLLAAPFEVLTPMGGSFKFDPRGALDGDRRRLLSERAQASGQRLAGGRILAAWGLEHARPDEFATRRVRYAAWSRLLPPPLARAALTGAIPSLPMRRFRFELDLSGKNKVVTFAQEEIS